MGKTNKQKVKSSWRLVIILSIFFSAIILIQDVVRESVMVHSELKGLSESLREEIKGDVLDKVEIRIFDIEAFIEQSQSQQQKHLFVAIDSVHAALSKSAELLVLEDELIQRQDFIDTVEEYALADLLHEFYLLNTDGMMYFDGITTSEVSVDVSDVKDVLNNNYYMTLMTSIQNSPSGEGNLNAYIQEGEEIIEYKFVGYQIPGTDYIVMTRGSTETFLNTQIDNYFSRFGQLYQDSNEEILVFRGNGDIIFHNDSDNIGGNIALLFEEGTLQRDMLVELEISVTGYVSIEQDDLEVKINDIGYYEYITGTDLGIYIIEDTELFNTVIDDFVGSNITKILSILLPIYAVLTILLTIIVRKIIKNIKLSEKVFEEEEILYKTLANTTEDFIIITNKQGDIKYLNDLARNTIFNSENDDLINLDQLMIEEDGFKVLVGVQNNYYIKYSVLPINFNSEESDLYIIKDVTEKVKKERELEALTLQDDLTKLGDRRKMIKDYTEEVLPQVKDGNKAFIVMMDLDNFKTANDTYGHGFGDEVLINISNVFHEVNSTNLKVYRVGGDEFAILATNTTQNTLLSILRKLRNKISNFKYRNDIDISFSGGLVEINIKNAKRRLSDYYSQADELLYMAKKEGKGKVKI